MTGQVLDLDAYRALIRDGGDVPSDALLRKGYVPYSIKAAGERALTFTISTGAVDRDHDTIAVDGWDLGPYRKNPVVLWAHDSRDLPLARASAVGVRAGALVATADFVPADVYPFAETVLQMLKGGFLNATSVGFQPKKGAWNMERGGMDFMEQTLLEFSIVPVPSNPEALVDAKDYGIDTTPLLRWAEKVLDSHEPGGLWVPRKDVERVFRTLAPPAVVVPSHIAVPSDEPPAAVAKALDLVLALNKRGRVLSAANEERLRTARGHGDTAASTLTDLCAALDDVLAQMDPEDPEEPMDPMDPMDCAAPSKAAEPDPPFVLIVPEPRVPTYTVDPKALAATVTAAVSEVVAERVRRAAGRLD